MKKVLLVFTLALCLLTSTVYAKKTTEETDFVSSGEKPTVTDHEKINVYIFRGSGCSHCYEALEYFNSLGDEYSDYFEVKAYEVWYSTKNQSLLEEVKDSLGITEDGVPMIVVGEKYFVGFASSTGTAVINQALNYYQDSKYTDVVSQLAKDGSYDEQTLYEACVDEEIITDTTKEESHNNDTLIVVGIFVFVIGGIAALIITSRKK